MTCRSMSFFSCRWVHHPHYPHVRTWMKVPDTVIINIALSFKVPTVLRAKGVNQQQCHGQGRSAPVQLAAAGHDITQSNTISRQLSAQKERHGPDQEQWTKLTYIQTSSVAFTLSILYLSVCLSLCICSSNSEKILPFSLCPVVFSQGCCHTVLQSCISRAARPMNFQLRSCVICSVSVSCSSVSCIPKPPETHQSW